MGAVPASGNQLKSVLVPMLAIVAALSHVFVPTLVLAAIDPVTNTGAGVDGITASVVRLGTSPWTIPALLLFDLVMGTAFLIASRRRPALSYVPVVLFASVTLLFPLLAYPWGQ